MIYNELNTALRFYDDLDKQNRRKSNCASVCDFKLFCPVDKILPFQFKINFDDSALVNMWSVRCAADDSEALDLLDKTDYITIDNLEEKGTFVTYSGSTMGISLPCGNYYLLVVINTDAGEFMYFSEVFTVTEGMEDTSFSQSLFPVYSAWVWYTSSFKRIENHDPCNRLCPYTIMCGNDALIPFQYKAPSATTINSWILTNGECSVILDISLLTIQTISGHKNIIYNGGLIDLPCGVFYSEMVIDGITHYSEPILITNAFETSETNYILQETGDKLLQEDNFGLLHEGT